MKKCISFVLLLSLICLLHAQTDVQQQNSDNSVDCRVRDVEDQEERCEDSQLSLLRCQSYGKIEVNWRISSQPLWFQSEEDTVVATTEEKWGLKRSCLTFCIIGTVVAACFLFICFQYDWKISL